MHRHGPDRVVYLELVEQVAGEDGEEATDRTDDDSFPRPHHCTASCRGYKIYQTLQQKQPATQPYQDSYQSADQLT